MKFDRLFFYISFGLLTVLMLYSASMYIQNTEQMQAYFEQLGYSGKIVIPLAVAKILGLIAIWFIPNKILKQLAFLGFFIDVVLAFIAHIQANDGQYLYALIGIVLVTSAYLFWWRSTKKETHN